MKTQNLTGLRSLAGRNQSLAAIMLGALAASAVSCSGTSAEDSKKASETSANSSAQWAIHIYTGDGQQIDLPPTPELGSPNGGSGATSNESTSARRADTPGGVHTQANVDGPDGSVGFEQYNDTNNVLAPKSWSLMFGAAVECGVVLEAGWPFRAYNPVVPPWATQSGTNTQAWYIFEAPPASCDQLLVYEEALSCVADKLSEIADAVAPITWELKYANTTSVSMPRGPWVIPPQSTKDRFIVRDLAISALAHLALLDTVTPTLRTQGAQDCQAAYLELANNPSLADGDTARWFGLVANEPKQYKYFPLRQGETPSHSNVVEVAKDRLTFNTMVLRHGSELLHDLIEDSVQADLAGTEQRRATAADPRQGNLIAWGGRENGEAPYNTMAHAIRVLTQRWEIGPYQRPQSTTPVCGNTAPLDVLNTSFRTDVRAQALSVSTPGQERAYKLVEAAGIVIPKQRFANLDGDSLRQAVINQLQEQFAAATGMTVAAYKETGPGKQIEENVKAIGDGDLKFALERSFEEYLLLTDEPMTLNAIGSQPAAGLKKATVVSQSLSNLGGIALESGIPRGELTQDVMPRAGKIQTAAQCTDNASDPEAVNPPAGQDDHDTSADPAPAQNFVMQDAFALAQTYQQRLTRIAIASQLYIPSSEQLVRNASAAVAQVRSWSGHGKLVAIPTGVDGGVSTVWLHAIGFDPGDFGVSDPQAMLSQISLVTGSAVAAECESGTRKSCPADYKSYVFAPSSSRILTASSDDGDDTHQFEGQHRLGYYGTHLMFEFSGAAFSARHVNQGQVVYVVLKHDPNALSGQGKVLGTLALRSNGKATAVAVSDFQKEKLNQLLGIGPEWAHLGLEIGRKSMAYPKLYCNGAPRDIFVPLENELTSDSDQYENSWRHYLTLAEQAAARADQLGNDLINMGIQEDMRRENAASAVAETCGEYPDLSGALFSNGHVEPGGSDQTLQDCLSQSKQDVVVFGPLAQGTDADKRKDIRENILNCLNEPASHPYICTEHPNDFTFSSLGFTNESGADTANLDECRKITAVMDSLRSSGLSVPEGFETVSYADWKEADSLGYTLENSHLEVYDENGNWRLTVPPSVIMDSGDVTAWPGCHRQNCDADDIRDIAAVFDKLYRTRDGLLGDAPENSEVAELLWRVEGSLWTMGAFAGYVPAGVFRKPVPAANFSVSDWGNGGPAYPSVLTVFGSGLYTAVGDSFNYSTENDASQWQSLENGRSIGWRYPHSTEMPEWLNEIYDSRAGNHYLHFFGTNPRYPLNDPTANVAGFYATNLSRLAGLSCQSFGEDGQGGGGSTGQAVQDFRLLKAKVGWFPLCWTPSPDKAGWTLAWGIDDGTKNFTCTEIHQWVGTFLTCFDDGDPKPADVLYDYPQSRLPVEQGCGNRDAEWCDQIGESCMVLPQWLLETHCSQWTRQAPGGALCSHDRIGPSCAHDSVPSTHNFMIPNFYELTKRVLQPSHCGPGERMAAFVNSYPPTTSCGAASQMIQTLGLACMLSRQANYGTTTDLAKIETVEQIGSFSRWLAAQSARTAVGLNRFYLESVPSSVVTDIQRQVATSGSHGAHGAAVAEIEEAILKMKGAWVAISSEFSALSLAVNHTKVEIDLSKTQLKEKETEVAAQQMNLQLEMAHTVVGGFMSGGNPIGIGCTIEKLQMLKSQLATLDKLKELAGVESEDKVLLALNDLNLQAIRSFETIQQKLLELQSAHGAALTGLDKVRQSELKAQHEIAGAAGQDYFMDANGKPVAMPLNTALRRHYDTTKRRYESALRDAKYLAYIARVAIEQRIGVRLDQLHEKVGPLEAPDSWADDVCRLSGIDYEKMRDTSLPAPENDAGVSSSKITIDPSKFIKFADPYVGDYVAKLKNFVEYYNIQYPSHDGDDTTVISMGSDWLAPATCVGASKNLLLYSARLGESHVKTSQPSASDVGVYESTRSLLGDRVGWESRSCGDSDSKCLTLRSLASLASPNESLDGSLGVTWLHETSRAPSVGGADAGTDADVDGGSGETSNGKPPSRAVWQRVELDPGVYILSWWDQAVDSEAGTPIVQGSGGNMSTLRVGAYGENWKAIEEKSFQAQKAVSAASPWPERRFIEFSVKNKSAIYVAFSVSDFAEAAGSVAITDVQLEQVAGAGGLPSDYVATTSSRTGLSTECHGGGTARIRSAFTRRCETNVGCYYESTAPLVLDTSLKAAIQSNPTYRLASGNFNFRHVSLALNLVGTGLIDCSESSDPACWGSGFVEYTLVHDAFHTGVLGRDGETEYFNFGSAGINHAKALTAERFITIPLSSADSSLLNQQGIEKTEFRGRPMDGSYKLRVWDRPGLMWSRLEDIQFVFKYHYWSAIRAEQTR